MSIQTKLSFARKETASSSSSSIGPTCRVVCLRRKDGVVVSDCDVYIGRAETRGGWNLPCSKWHNPFRVAEHGLGSALDQYRAYLLANDELMAQLPELVGKSLGCWCKKKTGFEPCHGDVLRELIESR